MIGLAGGIGAGKSSVAKEFARLGAAVLDFDHLAHEELDAKDVQQQLRAWWGEDVVSEGRVNRRRVASIVFANPSELARLEGLLYPRLKQRGFDALERLMDDDRCRAVVLDAPKLFEAGLDAVCDVIVFVEADRAARLERLARSRGWDQAELDRRENLQNPLDNKRDRADYIVMNCGSIEHLRSQVERVFKSVLSSFS